MWTVYCSYSPQSDWIGFNIIFEDLIAIATTLITRKKKIWLSLLAWTTCCRWASVHIYNYKHLSYAVPSLTRVRQRDHTIFLWMDNGLLEVDSTSSDHHENQNDIWKVTCELWLVSILLFASASFTFYPTKRMPAMQRRSHEGTGESHGLHLFFWNSK